MLKDKKRISTLETANPLDTNEVTTTQNPQDSSANPAASDAADFQQTAPSETLNQNAESLSVASTGEPNDTPAAVAADSISWVWTGLVVAIIIIAVYVIAKILKEEAEDDQASAMTATPAVATSRPTVKKSPKKKSAKKKSTRKKATKKR